jgi:hypothetical protein
MLKAIYCSQDSGFGKREIFFATDQKDACIFL